MLTDFNPLKNQLGEIRVSKRFGKVIAVGGAAITVSGLSRNAHVGDQVKLQKSESDVLGGEIISLATDTVLIMPYGPHEGIAIGNPVELLETSGVRPSKNWIGRIVDAFGAPLDGRSLYNGDREVPLRQAPPNAANRRALGGRLTTSLAVFNTLLPIARGQRIGVFSGSGVGKSTLIAEMARGLECDVVVIALIGERGRELREFTEKTLGPEGMKRAILIVATSDQSPLIKRRAAWMAMAVAEYFRDSGKHVLLLMDSVTRFAEAHREVALTAGETPSLRAFPPSTANLIASLAERAGPGCGSAGDITAVFSVLVAASDMDEPIADITRGVLDGHIILDRKISERGRFPAIDTNRSVSRSLPEIASPDENAILSEVRKIVSTYEQALPMIQTGLYVEGSDTEIDNAITVWPQLDDFFSRHAIETPQDSFLQLMEIIGSKKPIHTANQRRD